MIRTGQLAGMALAAIAASAIGLSPAWSQVDPGALRDRDAILQQQDIARQNALAAQREATAARNHYDAQMALRPLDAAPFTPSTLASPSLRPSLPSLPATPPRGPDASDYTAQVERLDRLTDESLAQGNARLRAITPAQ